MKNVAKILALSAFLTSAPALAEAPKWKISESNGTVNVLRAGVSKIAISGGQLRPGDVVSTSRKSRAVLVRGQEYVVVSPSSRIRISEPQKSGGLFQFFNEVGNVLFRIDKKATPHFGVKTPYLAAVVKGTTFSVTVSEAGTAVQVTEGAVQVSTNDGGAQKLLSPGMIGMVTQDQQFRLTITGTAQMIIDSPNAPVGLKTEKSESGDAPDPVPTEESVEIVDIAASGTEGVIRRPVVDQPVSFSELTGGLVSDQPAQTAPVQLAMLDTGASGSFPGIAGGANSDTPSQGILNNSNSGNETAAAASGGNPPAGGENGGLESISLPSTTPAPGNSGNTPAAGGGSASSGSPPPATGGKANGGGTANGGGNANAPATGGNANGGGAAKAGGDTSNGNANGGGTANAGGNGNGNNANANGATNGGGNGNGNNGNGNGNGGSNGGGNGNGNNGNANGVNNGESPDTSVLGTILEGVNNSLGNGNANGNGNGNGNGNAGGNKNK